MKKLRLNIGLLFLILFSITGCGDVDSNTSSSSDDGKGGSLAVFALKGEYLYTVDHKNLNIFSLKNPEKPVKVGGVFVGFNIETLFPLNDYLFIGSRNGMFIYDIAYPETPKLLSKSVHFTACDPVVANETNAFVTLHSNNFCGNNRNVLISYDIKDPTKPIEIAQRQMKMPRGLALYNNYLIVCDEEMVILDISNPKDSRFLKSIPHQFKDVVIYNNTLFAFGESRISQYKWEDSNLTTLEIISTLNY